GRRRGLRPGSGGRPGYPRGPRRGRSGRSRPVKQRDVARMALGGVAANKRRSALTMLGVLIGVSAVIILVAVGTGSSRSIEARIDALGTNTLTVFNTGRFGSGVSSTGTQSQTASLTIADVKQISNHNNAPDVESVSPV